MISLPPFLTAARCGYENSPQSDIATYRL